MSQRPEDPEEPARYAVRFSTEAQQNIIEAAHARLDFDGNAQAAQEMIDAFYDEASRLRTFPYRFPAALHESREIGLPLRRRNVGQWAMFYCVEEQTPDGPSVRIVFLWPAVGAPLRADQARRIASNQ